MKFRFTDPTEKVFRKGIRLLKKNKDSEAIQNFLKAEEEAHIGATYELGVLHLEGRHYPQNIDIGIDKIKAAANKGYLPALNKLGIINLEKDDPTLKKEGLELLKQVAASSEKTTLWQQKPEVTQAQHALGTALLMQEDIHKYLDQPLIEIYEEGIQWLEQSTWCWHEESIDSLREFAEVLRKHKQSSQIIPGQSGNKQKTFAHLTDHVEKSINHYTARKNLPVTHPPIG